MARVEWFELGVFSDAGGSWVVGIGRGGLRIVIVVAVCLVFVLGSLGLLGLLGFRLGHGDTPIGRSFANGDGHHVLWQFL